MMERALLDSTVACILEFGVAGATVSRIARRANATGGAVQHHFGMRDGLLLGVVDDFGQRLKVATQATVRVADSLEDRVDAVCDVSWNVVSSSHYRAIIQILLAVQEKETLYTQIFDRLKGFERDLDDLWVRIFEGSGLGVNGHYF